MYKALGLVLSTEHQSGKPVVQGTSRSVCQEGSAGQEDSGPDSVMSTHTSLSQLFHSHFAPAGILCLVNTFVCYYMYVGYLLWICEMAHHRTSPWTLVLGCGSHSCC